MDGNLPPLRIKIPATMKFMHREFQCTRMQKMVAERIGNLMRTTDGGPELNDEERLLLAFGFGILSHMLVDNAKSEFVTWPAYPVWVTWNPNAGFWTIHRINDDRINRVLVGTFGPDGPDPINEPKPSVETMKFYETTVNEVLKQQGAKKYE